MANYQRFVVCWLLWLVTQGIPQLQAPLSLLLGCVGVATVSTVLEANKLARRALVWAQTPLRKSVNDSFCVVGWSDASWACRLEGSSQGGYLIGVTNTSFLEQAVCKVTVWSAGTVESWLDLQEARMQRSCKQLQMQKENSHTFVCHFGKSSEVQRH